MYCPNCGEENQADQHYCRYCGLKLDAIVQMLGDQFPTMEYAKLRKRKERFEKLGLFSLSLAGFLAFALIFTKAAYYKIMLFGENVIFGAAFVAFLVFGLLSVFFFNYPKLFMKFEKINPRLPAPEKSALSSPGDTPLIEDRPFEPANSVTEDSTELLKVRRDTRKL
jgi:hypothetical protein